MASLGACLAFAAMAALAWYAGLPFIGLPGQLQAVLDLERERLDSSLAGKLAIADNWLFSSLRLAEAWARAGRSASPFPASTRPPDKADGGRPDAVPLQTVAGLLLGCVDEGASLLVVDGSSGRMVFDSSGRPVGMDFPFMADLLGKEGQFLAGDGLFSFVKGEIRDGTPSFFIVAAPLERLWGMLGSDRLDRENHIAFGVTDADGRLLSRLELPNSPFVYANGEVFEEGKVLDRLPAGERASILTKEKQTFAFRAAWWAVAPQGGCFFLAITPHGQSLARINGYALIVGIYLLFLAALAALFSSLVIKAIFRPLGQLEPAITAIAQSEPFSLPGVERGEFAGISHALASLARKADASRKRIEDEVEERTRMLRLTADLCETYAKDATETATVAAVNMLERSFRADSAALFYINANQEYRYCLAGTSYPIVLPESRWHECVRPHGGKALIARFGPWSPPGLEIPLASWISYRLYAVDGEGGYIFLGRANGYWSMKEESDLVSVAQAIAPIIKVRREREIEEQTRENAEERLAANEKRLRTFFEGSRDMIYTADSEDVVTDINAAGIGLLQRSGKEEIVGRQYSEFAFNAEDRRLLLERVGEVGYAADYEIVLKRADGSNVFCLETAYAIRDPDGNILELQGIVKDITERISSESALWKSSIELADANLKFQRAQTLMVQHEKLASIGQLAAGVAHEINNPLGFLKSNHAMVEKYIRKIVEAWEEAKRSPAPDIASIEMRFNLGYLFAQIDAILAESDEGFGRIMHIVGNLKSFSRTEQGGEYSPYDVNAGIESTLIVARNEIKYVADVKKSLGELPPVRARGSEINQVLLNILVNAAQAIEGQKRKEKGLIEIRTVNLGDRVLIGIRDDGPGIPEKLRMKIFDPFFTTKEPGKGTGLGLSISYDIIVTKHEGRLTVDCGPEGGTTFTLELPIAGPKQDDDGDDG